MSEVEAPSNSDSVTEVAAPVNAVEMQETVAAAAAAPDNKLAAEAARVAEAPLESGDAEKAADVENGLNVAQDGSGLTWSKQEEARVLRKVDLAIVSGCFQRTAELCLQFIASRTPPISFAPPFSNPTHHAFYRSLG